MKTISRYIMTLALLLTAVTGAWAISDPNSVYWDNQTWKGWTENVTTHTVGDITITCSGNAKAYESTGSGEPLAMQAGANDAITFTSNGKPFASVAITTGDQLNVAGWTYNSSTWSYEWSGEPTTSITLSGCNIDADVITFTFGTAEAAITVEPGSSANTWTFSMPGSDVVLTPIYAKAATFATTGTGSEAKPQLPAAAEGVIAGTDASLIAEGTGIVAFAGTSTEVTQGTLMYAVGTSATEAPALTSSDWKNTAPTAKDVADDGATVYVWYYIKGADAPDGDAATLDNTFDDTEPACLTVTIAAAPTYAVTLSDEDNDISALDNYKGQEIWVNYTRSFTASTASTVCLPFAYTKKAADGSFYAFTNIEKVGNEYVATMTEPGLSTLEANTPYLYMPNATGIVSFSGEYTIPNLLEAGSTTSNGWTFKGTYETIEWTTAPTGIYGFSAQNANDGITQGQFVKVGAYVRIAPMRCYLENASFAGARGANGAASEVLPETIKVRLISANGEVTAIGSLSTKTGEVTLDNDDWYSLDGRRIQNPTKGVYIKNGKKVVIK